MANTKLDRIERDIEKTRAKILEYQKRLKDLEAQKIEEENAQIVQMVKAVHLDGAQLAAFLSAKKLFRSVTALLAALVLMGGFSVTAFAGGGDVSDEPPTPVTETEPEETTGGYEPQPLTPEGNMSLVDDITGEASGDKQFITVVTKNGNYFYIIIDRAEDGNQVDEKDLLQLMEDEQTEAPACSCTEKCVAGSVNTDCPVCSVNMSECAGKEAEPEPEETEQPEPEEDKGGGMGGAILLVVLLLAAVGGGAFYYFKIMKPKKDAAKGSSNLDDLDFDEDDEDEEELETEQEDEKV